MSLRHESRKIVMQSMYELDMRDELFGDAVNFKNIIDRYIIEAGELVGDGKFVRDLAETVQERLLTADEIIKKAAPEWPIEKINVVDRNILRIGLSELLFGDKINVPPKVAIDEAIEIAKEFGGETSGRFVNGVLGAVYKELGEPEKDVKKKVSIKSEQKAGAIIFADYNNKTYMPMLLDVFGYWTFSKGSVEGNESIEACATREAREELGLDIKIIEKLGDNTYVAHNPEKGKTNKNISYFLAEAKYGDITLGESKGLVDAKWYNTAELDSLKMYKDLKPILLLALSKIQSKTKV